MNLPPIPPEELDLARAYVNAVLGDSPSPDGEDLIKLVANYGSLYTNRRAYLEQLAGKGTAPKITADVIALREFQGTVCPACSGPKRGGDDGYWFCNKCWKLLDLKMRQALRHSFRGQDLPEYWRALHWLKSQVSKAIAQPAHGRG